MNNDTNLQDADDEGLLRRLRRAGADIDPVPDAVSGAAKAAFTWRTIDAELAALAFDSRVGEPVAGVRGSSGPRLLNFKAPELAVEVEIEIEIVGSRRRLVGQLVPPCPGNIEIRQPERTIAIEADAMGRFHADDLGPGPVSLRCRVGYPATKTREPTVETDWVFI